MTTWAVPYFDLELGEAERNAVTAVIASGWLSMGPQLQGFERAFAHAHGLPAHGAVAVTNCTVALHLALAALDVGRGDEVIVPAVTFVADANAVVQCGATPIFADLVGPDEWTIDPEDVARKVTPRTKAIIAVHYAGYPCRMGPLRALAAARGLRLIEDAAHAPGVRGDDGHFLGTTGDVGCFSFFSNKNMTTGEGGMVVSRDEGVLERLRAQRSHGMTSSSYERFRGRGFSYDVVTPGFNYRMDEMRAALGRVQLERLPAGNAARRRLVLQYRQLLADRAPEVHVPFADRDGEHAYHIFPVLLPRGVDRDDIMQRMAARGVQTSIHYRPIPSFRAYAGPDHHLPVTEAIAPRILSLPLYPTLARAQLELVVDALVAAVAGASRAA